jgi:hypothetical protein
MFINGASREINVRIVYCGATGSEARKNLVHVHGRLSPDSRGELRTVEREARRVTFFDFLPEGLPSVRGFAVRVHLYALDSGTPSVDDCDVSAFSDVDGVVFVVDPRPARLEANIAGLERVQRSAEVRGYRWDLLPAVFQVLHRGDGNAAEDAALREAIAPGSKAWTVARVESGEGMFATVKEVLREVLSSMAKGHLREWTPPPRTDDA